MKALLVAGFIICSLAIPVGAEPKLAWVHPVEQQGCTYERVEVTFTFAGDYDNPFDSRQVVVDLVVEQPDVSTIRIPAFYYQDYERQLMGSVELLTPVGDPTWKARFVPTQEGQHRYWLEASDRQGNSRSEVVTLTAGKGQNPGFVRVSPDQKGFVFDDGTSYFPIGINLAHSREDLGTFEYDLYLSAMGTVDLNWTRLWMAPPWRSTAAALEWTDGQFPAERGKIGLRRYSMQAAWRVDHFVDTATALGIYVMLCFGDERELESNTELSRAFWHANPYNSANGGPVRTPTDFFTNEEAKATYKDRLRYIVGRWGYSTNVIWEFWNEIDHPKLWGNTWSAKRDGVVKWHQEMGQYLRDIDPYRHLISTSFVSLTSDPKIWNLPEIDFTQIHIYNVEPDTVQVMLDLPPRYLRRYPKPVLVSEIGTGGTARFAHQGGAEEVAIHNALWASVFSEAAGGPIWWYWHAIHNCNYYHHYGTLTRFLQDVPVPQLRKVEAAATPGRGVLALAAVGPASAAVWVQSQEHNWANIEKQKAPAAIPNVKVSIPGIAPGLYEVVRWNTWDGRCSSPIQMRVESAVELEVGTLEQDVAFTLTRVGD
jgi:hypothetical protein